MMLTKKRLQKWPARVLCGIALACLLSLIVPSMACSNANSSNGSGGGTPAGTYALTVTGNLHVRNGHLGA